MANQTPRLRAGYTDERSRARVSDSHSRTTGAGSSMSGTSGPIQSVTEGASNVLGDAFDLAELQGRLLVADTQSFMQTAKIAILGLVVTLALLIAALPVVAIGMAQWLAWGLDWPLWTCQLAVGLALVTMGLSAGLWCVRRLRTSFRAFETSKQEAAENLRWFKQALSRTLPTT